MCGNVQKAIGGTLGELFFCGLRKPISQIKLGPLKYYSVARRALEVCSQLQLASFCGRGVALRV